MKTTWTSSRASELFNSTIVSHAVVACDQAGILDALNKGEIDIPSFCKDNGMQEDAFWALMRVLETDRIVRMGEDKVAAGQNFQEVFTNKGYFTWLIKGYAYALQNMDTLLTAKTLSIASLKRDGASIAKAGKDYGSQFVNSYFDETLRKLNAKHVVDFGCGSADRLIGLAKKDPSIKCIGIDINADAVELARRNVEKEGLSERIKIVCGDVNDLNTEPGFENVDTLFCFFMGHDLWPKENCKKVFESLNRVFPNATNFLLCDTYKSDGNPHISPIFTLGFELTHAFMSQMIPTYSEWFGLFKELGWTLKEVVDTDIPYSTIFNLKIK